MVNPYEVPKQNEVPKQIGPSGSGKISLSLTLLTVFILALSIGLFRLNFVLVHSAILAVSSLILFGISIGWPIGCVIAGRRGAIVGGGCGALFVFAALYLLAEVFDALG